MNRCKNTHSNFLFCDKHKRQWLKWLIPIFTIVSLIIGICSFISQPDKPEKQKALYLQATGYFNSDNYRVASELFKKLYDVNPDYPNCAYFLGKALFYLYRYNEALSILIPIPSIEDHIDTYYMIGKIYFDIKNYSEANNYLELAKEKLYYEKNSRYWTSEFMVLECLRKINKMPLDIYASKVMDFCKAVDFELENSYKHFSNFPSNKDISFEYSITYKELDWIRSQRVAAFVKLYELSQMYYVNDINIIAFNTVIKAFNYDKFPIKCTGSGLCLKTDFFMEAISYITLLLSEIQYLDKSELGNKINEFRILVDGIEQSEEKAEQISTDSRKGPENRKVRVELDFGRGSIETYPEMMEFLNTIKIVFGFSRNPLKIVYNNFIIRYFCVFEHNKNIEKINIFANEYSLNKNIYIQKKEDFIVDEEFVITPGFVFREKPIFRATRILKNGNPYDYFDIFPPWIKYGNGNKSANDHFVSHLHIH